MDKTGPPNLPHILLTRGHLRLEEQKGTTACHLVDGGSITGPDGEDI